MHICNFFNISKICLITIFIFSLTFIEFIHSSSSSWSKPLTSSSEPKSKKRRANDDKYDNFKLNLQVFQGTTIDEIVTPSEVQKKFSECFEGKNISWPGMKKSMKGDLSDWSKVCIFFAEIQPGNGEEQVCHPHLKPVTRTSRYAANLFEYNGSKVKVDFLKCHCQIIDRTCDSKFQYESFVIARFTDTEYFKLRLPSEKFNCWLYVQKFITIHPQVK